MGKEIWIAIIVFVALMTLQIIIVESAESNMEQHLGESIIIDKDTVTIIDHSLFFGEYTLSDGRTISEEFLNIDTKNK